jgi:hypothetical protein
MHVTGNWYQRRAAVRLSLVKINRRLQNILVAVKYTCPSLIISHNTSDGSIGLPVANVPITKDLLILITVTSILHQYCSIVQLVDDLLEVVT